MVIHDRRLLSAGSLRMPLALQASPNLLTIRIRMQTTHELSLFDRDFKEEDALELLPQQAALAKPGYLRLRESCSKSPPFKHQRALPARFSYRRRISHVVSILAPCNADDAEIANDNVENLNIYG